LGGDGVLITGGVDIKSPKSPNSESLGVGCDEFTECNFDASDAGGIRVSTPDRTGIDELVTKSENSSKSPNLFSGVGGNGCSNRKEFIKG